MDPEVHQTVYPFFFLPSGEVLFDLYDIPVVLSFGADVLVQPA